MKESNDGKAFCKYCNRALANNKTHFDRHEKSELHQKTIKNLKNQRKIDDNDSEMEKIRLKKEKVNTAHLLIIMFLVQHNLSISLIGPLINLIKAVAADSLVVKDLIGCRNKTTRIITDQLLKEHYSTLREQLQNQYFSITIDETTDASCSKCLVIVVRFFDHVVGGIKDKFLTL